MSVDWNIVIAGISILPYFSLGVCLLGAYSLASVVFASLYQRFSVRQSIQYAMVMSLGLVSPGMAILASFGLLFYIGHPFEPSQSVTPFLVLAIGVDDAFLLINGCQRQIRKCSPGTSQEELISLTLREVGPSILITSLTNSLAFSIGSLTISTPAVGYFCQATSMGMAMDFFFQMTFFVTLLSFVSPEKPLENSGLPMDETSNASSSLSNRFDSLRNNVKKYIKAYCRMISSWKSRGIVILMMLVYWIISIWGAWVMKSDIGSDKIFLPDSKAEESVDAYINNFWKQASGAYIVINNPPNLTDPIQYDKFYEMVSKLESMNHSLGPNYTDLWLNDYQTYSIKAKEIFGDPTISDKISDEFEEIPIAADYDYSDAGNGNDYDYEDNDANSTETAAEIHGQDAYDEMVAYDEDDGDLHTTNETDGSDDQYFYASNTPIIVSREDNKNNNNNLFKIASQHQEMQYTTKYFREFFNISAYRYKSRRMVRLNRTEESTTMGVESFMFRTYYGRITNWWEKVAILLRFREIAAEYAEWDVSIWDQEAMYSDQLMMLRPMAVSTILFTFLTMFFVCLFLIPSWSSVILGTMSVGAISVGVIGFLSWWYIDLNPVSLSSIIMAIGFSVDYTAHVTYHYFQADEGGIHETLCAVGWPMVQAGVSTLLCILALGIINSYMVQVFRKTVFLVVTLGLIHGLLILPSILSIIPQRKKNETENTKSKHPFPSGRDVAAPKAYYVRNKNPQTQLQLQQQSAANSQSTRKIQPSD